MFPWQAGIVLLEPLDFLAILTYTRRMQGENASVS